MIELRGITYSVSDNGENKLILDNVNCMFEDNIITAITGQNGSGKSTLTKIIMGIIKPTAGKVLFNGVDITNKTIDERARMGINYAFQQPITFRGITIKELIDLASNEQNSVAKACEYLSKVGICAKEYINRNFDKTLSGGEQKRIELALTLAKKGNTFIFDEPEAGIDLWSFEKIAELFNENNSYIVVSHQTKLLEHANKIIVMEKGRIKEIGKPNKILKSLTNNTCGRIKNETR